MKNWNDINGTDQTALQKILQTGPIRLLLAGMYFLLGVSRARGYQQPRVQRRRAVNRSRRLSRARDARLSRDDHRDISHLRWFLPRGLTPNQFNERCTRLSHMGRFQIYDWLYYRWEFWRLGAMKLRFRAPLTTSLSLKSCGLSEAHQWPD